MSATAVAPPEKTALGPQRVRTVFGALMLVMLLASLDQTIVSTALPTIVGELGGLAHLSWIVTAYLLTTTIATPLYGKLGDLYGRKAVLQSAILIFLLGSALCGMSRSMGQLIAFRAVQGLGGGGLMVTTMAVIGDIIPPRERGRYQGFFGAVFGVSTVVGPLIGGFFVEHLNWRWIFYINLPLGIVSILVIGLAFAAPKVRRAHAIDFAGAALLAIALSALVLYTSLGGHTVGWTSPLGIGLVALAALGLAAFLLVEHKAAEPILPPHLFDNRTFVVASAVGFIVGLALFGSVTYMPIYLQVVKGVSPSSAGLQLTPMMGGVLLSSITSGQIITRIGRYRPFPIIGTAIMTLGLSLLATLGVDTPVWLASAFMLLLGLGLGMVMQVLVLAVQNAVEYRDLGVATSGATLFRSIGGSVGVSVFGAIFVAGLSAHFGTAITGAASDPAIIRSMPEAARAAYRAAFTDALHPVFVVAACIAACAFALTWFLKDVPLRGPVRAETIGESFAMPHDATSFEELEQIVARLQKPENRWAVFRRAAQSADVNLAPDEIWLLIQLCLSSDPQRLAGIAQRFALPESRLQDLFSHLLTQGMALRTADGSVQPSRRGVEIFRRMAAAHRAMLAQLCERWGPRRHADVKAAIDRLARSLMAEPPVATEAAPFSAPANAQELVKSAQ